MEKEAFLQKVVSAFELVLKDNLAGIYLHGSLAMGCFNPERSDIDLVIVVKEKLSKEEQRLITRHVLILNDLSGCKGIELSIVLESCAREFVYPTPFEYHFSEYHRERYQADPNYLCGGFEDPDLAAHFTVLYHRGITLYGYSIQELLQPVERTYYVQSILNDIGEAAKEIMDSPVYYSLNLCRVLFYLREGIVSSKQEGGEWGLRVLPEKYRSMINACLEEYSGQGRQTEWDDKQLVEFAEYMQNEINSSSFY